MADVAFWWGSTIQSKALTSFESQKYLPPNLATDLRDGNSGFNKLFYRFSRNNVIGLRLSLQVIMLVYDFFDLVQNYLNALENSTVRLHFFYLYVEQQHLIV